MEIRELFRDEVANLAEAGKHAFGARFPSHIQLRVLRDNPLAFLPVAVAGTDIVGVGLAELREGAPKRVGAVRLLASFFGDDAVDRVMKLALLSRLEVTFKSLNVEEIEVLGTQDLDFLLALKRVGYRRDISSDGPATGEEITRSRLVKRLRPGVTPWPGSRSLPRLDAR